MISVVIPAYNEEKRLPLLLESLRRQTLEWGKDFEVIVVDDGSTDMTGQIAKSYGCRLVSRESPHGPANARNAGARASKGNALVFLDADTVAEPELLERLIKRLEAGASLSTCYIRPDNSKYEAGASLTNLIFHVLTLAGLPHVGGYCIAMGKRDFIKAGGFPENMKLAEDHWLAMAASKLGKVSYITEPLLIVSTRRIDKNGAAFPVFQFFYTLAHVLFRVPIRRFNYEFGHF